MVSDQKRGKQARPERTVGYVSRFGLERVNTRVMELRWRREAAVREGSESDQAMPGRHSSPRAPP